MMLTVLSTCLVISAWMGQVTEETSNNDYDITAVDYNWRLEGTIM